MHNIGVIVIVVGVVVAVLMPNIYDLLCDCRWKCRSKETINDIIIVIGVRFVVHLRWLNVFRFLCCVSGVARRACVRASSK